jgi:hypothetical protein
MSKLLQQWGDTPADDDFAVFYGFEAAVRNAAKNDPFDIEDIYDRLDGYEQIALFRFVVALLEEEAKL